MEHERFIQVLDEHFEWTMGTSKALENRGKHSKGEPIGTEPPEGGAYPVVLASRSKEKRCEDNRNCQYDKTYSRTSTGWREWCHECRKHYNIYNQETLDLMAEFEATQAETNK